MHSASAVRYTDPSCSKCGEEETAYHFLGRCSAMMMARYSILESYLMDIMELQKVQPYTLLRFAKPQIYITFRLSRGCTVDRN